MEYKYYGWNVTTAREFEEALRERGFSRRQAKRICLYGFEEPDVRDARLSEESKLAKYIRRALESFAVR